MLLQCVSLLLFSVLGLSRCYLPCVIRNLSHYTCWQWNGGCPTANIGWCEWVFYKWRLTDFHLLPLWPRCLKRVMIHQPLVFSAVNWIFSSILFRWWKNSSIYAVFRMTKVSSTYLFQRLWGMWCCFKGLGFKMTLLHLHLAQSAALERQNMYFSNRTPTAWWYALCSCLFFLIILGLLLVFLLWSWVLVE